MGKYFTPALILLIILSLSITVKGQRFLLLEKAGSAHNYKYKINDVIYLKVAGDGNRIKGNISKLTDTSMVLDYVREIKFREVTDVYRLTWAREWIPELLIKAAVGYFLVVGINNVLQHVYPILPGDVLFTATALAGAGVGLSRILVRHYWLQKGWRLRLIDFDKLPSK